MKKILILNLIVGTFLLISGCSKSDVNGPAATDEEVIIKLIESDETLGNFESLFDEGGEVAFSFGKTTGDFYPIKVGRKITSIERTYQKEIIGDSALIHITTKFVGVLFIAGRYTPITPGDTTVIPDTVIRKSFIETIKRNVALKRIAEASSENRGWKINALSLPEGSTSVKNILIKKIEINSPDFGLITIESPLDFYFFIEDLKGRDFPGILKGRNVNLKVYLTSNTNKDDFVTLSYGSIKRHPVFRARKKLTLISSTPSGSNWDKVYEGNWQIGILHPFGRFHSVINAVTNETIFDDSAAVSSSTWGMPYLVK